MRGKRYLVRLSPLLIASLAFPAGFATEAAGASPPAAVAASAPGLPCFTGQQQQQGGGQQQQQGGGLPCFIVPCFTGQQQQQGGGQQQQQGGLPCFIGPLQQRFIGPLQQQGGGQQQQQQGGGQQQQQG
ncbi:hypothetical protein ABZY10_31920 [Streptomyces sp. NPDC006539]|nr:hypothetical protein OG987_12045 [Streptomyces sp. NBC_01620]